MEIQNNNVDQYSRRNNVEISGISQSVSDNQLEEKVADILKTIDVYISLNEVKEKNVIVHIINKKHCLQTMQNKKKLKRINRTFQTP